MSKTISIRVHLSDEQTEILSNVGISGKSMNEVLEKWILDKIEEIKQSQQ